ncbi:MAG: rRNA pseudouridine synthase [Clostridia bacterium]|nr:rRNA pseudouridine synthase [Clostridia bacterium]
MEKIRLQKYLASCGVASRRKCEELITNGDITVNGSVAQLGMSIDPDYDKVVYRGRVIKEKNKKIYIMMYKPLDCLTTAEDDHGRQTVIDIISRDISDRVFPVGRLDKNTEGLLLLTNDGEFSNRIIHPKYKIPKTYLALVGGGVPSPKDISALRRGVLLEDGLTQPAKIDIEKINPNGSSVVKITITEGKKRQVRRMFEFINHPVIELKRISVGKVNLGNLPYGKWRHLRPEEIKSLLNNQR